MSKHNYKNHKDNIHINNLTFSYRQKNNSNIVFQNLNSSFKNNRISIVLGRSGYGKSTLLKLLCGLLKPHENNSNKQNILISGLTPSKAISEHIIGYLPQESQPAPWRTSAGNLDLSLKMARIPRDKRALIISQTLTRLGLANESKRYPHQLSGGQCRRIAIAMALVTGPSLLLLDEPFKGLDVFTQREVYRFLLEIWGDRNKDGFWSPNKNEFGKSIIIVTHDLQEAIVLGDYIYIMSDYPVKKFTEVYNPLCEERSIEKLDAIRFHPKFQNIVGDLQKLL